MLRLYGLVAEVAPCAQGAGALAPVTILDYDLLSSITALAPALIPLLDSAEGGVYQVTWVDELAGLQPLSGDGLTELCHAVTSQTTCACTVLH